MTKKFLYYSFLFALIAVFISCTKFSTSEKNTGDTLDYAARVPGPGTGGQAGVITAGEWNDLNNWRFWDSISGLNKYSQLISQWDFSTKNRILVKVLDNNNQPLRNVPVQLLDNNQLVFSAKTNHLGYADLWAGLPFTQNQFDSNRLKIDIANGVKQISKVKTYYEGINSININSMVASDMIEIALVVDATGSMADELEFLKTEMLDVINRVSADNPESQVKTSSVFYRDQGDEYLTRVSQFTSDLSKTLNFINTQSADGGGDFPEAVHSALNDAVYQLQWNENSKSKILFLILDAPPHPHLQVIQEIHQTIKEAAKKGIRIIPITASGIDKATEFLMRYFAITTNGTYVFITNHSGIGNDHLEATVGEYEVELLNNLMVRLINEYSN